MRLAALGLAGVAVASALGVAACTTQNDRVSETGQGCLAGYTVSGNRVKVVTRQGAGSAITVKVTGADGRHTTSQVQLAPGQKRAQLTVKTTPPVRRVAATIVASSGAYTCVVTRGKPIA